MQKLDYMVLKKFEDLAEKAKRIHATQQISDIAAVVDAKKFQEWSTLALSLLQKLFGEESAHYQNFHAVYSKVLNIPYKESFDKCRAILEAAREEYEGGGQFDLQEFLEHAVLEYLAAHSAELAQKGEKEAACLLTAVLLESALQRLCQKKGIPDGPVEEMNEALFKGAVYQVGTRQRITDWWCIKEDVVRGRSEQYRLADIEEMLRGVQRFIEKVVA